MSPHAPTGAGQAALPPASPKSRGRNGLLLVFLAVLAVEVPSAAAAPRVGAVGCVGMTVSDLERSSAFYEQVLDFREEFVEEHAGPQWEALTGVFALRTRTARLRLGAECLELSEYLGPKGRPIPIDARSNDRSFQHVAIVVADMDRAYTRLRAARVEHASSGPQRLPDWNPNAAGIRAFYFKDPDRHVVEVIWFPPGKGSPRWRNRPGKALFLGIDHTAIVVADTEASVRFYRDALGFTIAGTSENSGDEQAHLNGVEGAHLRITTLRAGRGPGVELLEYLAPTDGRPYPPDARPNDLVHWQTTLLTDTLDETTTVLVEVGARRLSRSVARLPGSRLGRSRALLLRDPDGHALLLAEPDPAVARSSGER